MEKTVQIKSAIAEATVLEAIPIRGVRLLEYVVSRLLPIIA